MPPKTDQQLDMNGSLTSDPDLFSDNSWNLLLNSQDIAQRWRHGVLDVEHLIHVLFTDRSYKKIIETLPINHSGFLDKLEGFLAEQPISRGEELFIGEDLERLLENANHSRIRWGSHLIEISHLLIAIGKDKRIGAELFEFFGLPSERLEAELRQIPRIKDERSTTNQGNNLSPNSIRDEKVNSKIALKSDEIIEEVNDLESNGINTPTSLTLQKEAKALEAYGRDLTAAAKKGELDPVIGREPEIRQLIKVLSRRGKNNPVLIGAPGVGKTVIVELLAQRIIDGEVPETLKDLRLISLDLGALIAGAKFRGQFEERFRSVLTEIGSSDTGVVLFIDELHTVVSTERSNVDAGNLLKPVLASGDLRCIGATTPENYRRTVEKDQALSRRFQQVLIKEPNLDLSLEILRGLKERYELHHGVTIKDSALNAANQLADRYISDRCLPDKAIDLIDEAAAQLKLESTSKPQIIEETEAELKKVELSLIESNEKSEEDLSLLEESRIKISQDLSSLQERWHIQKSQLKKINQLSQKEEIILMKIEEAENIGNLEEAARLQYDELHSLQKRKLEIEDFLNSSQESGTSLIRDQVEAEDIADVVARWTGIPMQKVIASERQKLLNLENDLSNKVVGQIEAVQAVAAAIRRARAGMKDPKRPVGSFLFLGPTGVGKTELAKTLASCLFDEEEALVRLDMSEFMERNAVARLIGAPPGYVGYEEGGQLTEAVRRRPYAVLLLDEVEKAHPDVFNLLLQVLDEGRLTDSQGRTVDFRHTVVVMTSNLASRAILEEVKQINSESQDIFYNSESLQKEIDEALSKHFRPEFLNRIDEVIKFRPLRSEDLQKIVKLQITDLSNLLAEQGLELRVTKETINLLALEGYEPEYGARPLRRILRRKLENPLATQLLEEDFKNFNVVRVQPESEGSKELLFIPEN